MSIEGQKIGEENKDIDKSNLKVNENRYPENLKDQQKHDSQYKDISESQKLMKLDDKTPEMNKNALNDQLSQVSSTSAEDLQRKDSLNQDDSINNYEESSENVDECTEHKNILEASLNNSKEIIDIIYNYIKSSMQTYIKPRKSTKYMTYNQDSISDESKISSEFKSITNFRRYHINNKKNGNNKSCLDTIFGIYSERNLKQKIDIISSLKDITCKELVDENKVYEQIIQLKNNEELEDVERLTIEEIAKLQASDLIESIMHCCEQSFLKYDQVKFEILRSFDPYIPEKMLSNILKPELCSIFKDSNDTLSQICKVYNANVKDIITDIIYKIREFSCENKIDLKNEVQSNIKIMIRKVEKAEFHQNEIQLMVKANKKRRKQEETIVYAKSDKHIDIEDGKFICNIFNPEKFICKVDDKDMEEIYECLEKQTPEIDKLNNKTTSNENDLNKKSSTRFKIESAMIDFDLDYADKPKKSIEKQRKERIDLYLEEVKESVILNNSFWLDNIQEGLLNKFDCKIENNTIQCFPWGIKSCIKEVYRKIISEKKKNKMIKWNNFKGVSNQSLDKNLQITCERLYGSYPHEMIGMIIGDADENLAILKLYERAKIIVYLVKHGLLKQADAFDSKKKLLDFVTEIYKINKSEENEKNLIGDQTGEMYTEKMIYDCPFEAIFRIKSTFGRLKVLYHSEELSSLPDFTKLESMRDKIGIICRSSTSDKDSLINKYPLFALWSRERKLMLASRVQKQMKKLYNELFPYLSYKYLVEKEARMKQNEGEQVKPKLFVSEEIMFKSYVFYLYYLSLLKREDFNPETDLRIKIFCDCMQEQPINFSKINLCCCVYGLKKDQVIDLVKTLNMRKERIKGHIEKVCSLSEDNKKHFVAFEYQSQLLKEFKNLKNNDLIEKMIDIALGYKIEIKNF